MAKLTTEERQRLADICAQVDAAWGDREGVTLGRALALVATEQPAHTATVPPVWALDDLLWSEAEVKRFARKQLERAYKYRHVWR